MQDGAGREILSSVLLCESVFLILSYSYLDRETSRLRMSACQDRLCNKSANNLAELLRPKNELG